MPTRTRQPALRGNLFPAEVDLSGLVRPLAVRRQCQVVSQDCTSVIPGCWTTSSELMEEVQERVRSASVLIILAADVPSW